MNMSMNKLYNILWIDDEWDKMTIFQQECEELYALHLVPFRTRKAGIEALEKDLDHWDAVLLDAKMFDESDNELASLKGLIRAKQRLDELKMKKDIPYFISTGQPDLLSSDDFKAMFGDYYEKGKDDVNLIDSIIAAVSNTDIRQVRNFYRDVFDSLDSLEILAGTEYMLTDIFVPMHFPANTPNFRPVHHYNQLRQLMEYLFRVCNKVGLIPDQCMQGTNINLNQCSLYLAGKNATKAGVRYGEQGERIIPDYIEIFIRSILEFGNIHSHTVELSADDQLKIDAIFHSKKSKYIIFGLTMQICEVITWLADYIGKNNNKEKNLLRCKELPKNGAEYDGREMEPIKDEECGVWHCGECVVGIKSWTSGKKVKLKDVQPNTRNFQEKYPYFAKFDKI